MYFISRINFRNEIGYRYSVMNICYLNVILIDQTHGDPSCGIRGYMISLIK